MKRNLILAFALVEAVAIGFLVYAVLTAKSH
jgi:hypothetical protein